VVGYPTQEIVMDEDKFIEHLKTIEEDTINISNPRVVLMHPSCQFIISEGRRVIPTIIQYYKNNPELSDIQHNRI
jgi:hypothetical protein